MKVYDITSRQNEVFKTFLTYLTSKGIKDHRRAFIFGKKAVAQVLDRHRDAVRGVVLPLDGSAKVPAGAACDAFKLKNSLFDELDVFGSHSPFLLVETPEVAPWNSSDATQGCSLFIPFQDPSNVGAVLRSAAAFGVSAVILGEGAAHPFHPRSARAASGTLFLHKYFKARAEDFSEEHSIPVFALDSGGAPITDVKLPPKFILVSGVEGPGLQNRNLKNKIGIPISADVESLNAAVATSVALFAWRNSLK